MATNGGPSRRSHTKSRKGCKTCKRRHIRCDESFPQCRNCTKHQVRCDYMDNVTSEEQQNLPVTDLQYPQEIESTLDRWQRSGECSLAGYNIDLHAQGHHYTRNDLRLIYHALWSASHPLTIEFTVWSEKTPKFLMVAKSQPFLVHAILAFGAYTQAFEQPANGKTDLAYYHGGIALQGLQEAISSFSRDNADAVLAASILLSWQANEWKSWRSLINGIRTVISNMQSWKSDSLLADIVLEQERSIPLNFPGFSQTQFSDQPQQTRTAELNTVIQHIDNLAQWICLREEEATWMEQLRDYIQQLAGVRAANDPEEQFNHLYSFRKWLFCLPGTVLKSDTRDYQSLIVLAYYYAAAISLEQLYPNVAAAFCSTMVIKPLEEIFRSFDTLRRATQFPSQHTQMLFNLLGYPRSVHLDYLKRKGMPMPPAMPLPMPSHDSTRLSTPNFDHVGQELPQSFDDYRFGSQDSSAFSPQMGRQMSQVSSFSRLGTPFMEVPGFTWGDDSSAASSQGRHSSSYTFLSQDSGLGTDDFYNYDMSKATSFDYGKLATGFDPNVKIPSGLDFSGFVSPTSLWA